MAINKIKTSFPNFPLSINIKLYECFAFFNITDVKLFEQINKIILKNLHRLQPKNLIIVVHTNFKCRKTEEIQKNQMFFNLALREFEKRSVLNALNIKYLTLFMEVLSSDKILFISNREFFIDSLIHHQISNYSNIMKKKLVKNDEEVILRLPFFSLFLKYLTTLAFSTNELINFLMVFKQKEILLDPKHLILIMNVLSEKVKENNLNSKNLIEFTCESLKKSNLYKLRPEDFSILLKVLSESEISEKKILEICKRSFGFFTSAIHRFSDLDLCLSLCFLKKLKNKINFDNLCEHLIKAINRNILKSEYHTFEEIEEIRKLRSENEENFKIKRISSYSFLRDTINEDYKSIIKRQTQIINSLWYCCNIFLRNEKNSFELTPSLIWKEYAQCLNNIMVNQLLTIDNIQKLYDLRELFQINRYLGTEILFKNPDLEKILGEQEEFILKGFLERKKKFRNHIQINLETELKKTQKQEIKLETCQILNKRFPIDILLSSSKNNFKIAIIISNIYEERNLELINNKDTYSQYFSLKEKIWQFHFEGKVKFLVHQAQSQEIISEILNEINLNNC